MATIDIQGSYIKSPMGTLDDETNRLRLDPGRMIEAIDSFPRQLLEAENLASQVDWLAYKPTTPAGVCVCGMGGSAIGGDLVRSYWESESPVPMTVVRSDRLPEYINRFWMVIASSYSGSTQETLSAVDDACRRGCNILALTSGGRLAEQARTCAWPLITVPGGMMPRAALGYSFSPVMMALIRWGIVPDRSVELNRTAKGLESSRALYGVDIRTDANPAKRAALTLSGRTICVYGTSGYTNVVALRFKCQFAENSKAVAFANSLPELNHNEIVGIDASGDPAQMAVVLLRTGEESPVAQKRLDWVAARVGKRGIPVVSIAAIGENRLERMLSLVQVGDYISYYLAIANGQDPTPIPAIESLKKEVS